MMCGGACRSYWVWRACVASLCSMHVRLLRLPLPRFGFLADASVLGSSANTRRALCCVRGTASGSVQASHVCSFMHCLLGTRRAVASACIAAVSAALLSLGRPRCTPFCHVGCCSTIQSADATRRMRLCWRTALIVARGLLAGVLLGIGVQSEHRELGCQTSNVALPGMLLLRFVTLMMCGGPAIGYGALV
jgi:hypothetical protein